MLHHCHLTVFFQLANIPSYIYKRKNKTNTFWLPSWYWSLVYIVNNGYITVIWPIKVNMYFNLVIWLFIYLVSGNFDSLYRDSENLLYSYYLCCLCSDVPVMTARSPITWYCLEQETVWWRWRHKRGLLCGALSISFMTVCLLCGRHACGEWGYVFSVTGAIKC